MERALEPRDVRRGPGLRERVAADWPDLCPLEHTCAVRPARRECCDPESGELPRMDDRQKELLDPLLTEIVSMCLLQNSFGLAA